jgi:uncharacterized membrane protein
MSSEDPIHENGEAAAPKRRHAKPHVLCPICDGSYPASHTVPLAAIRPTLAERIRKDHPEIPADGAVCLSDLARYRSQYVTEILSRERGELSTLDREVIESIGAGETIAENTEEEYAGKISLGERLSDALAKFGGSWVFILLFIAVIVVWMTINAALLGVSNFDPYPFILLNLVLSCLAAFQAPIILMSQNRQEKKDRLRSDNDYQVNLKAELEIRHLHEKFDHLLNKQWERLAEIQEIQLEIMQDIAGQRRK